MAIVSPTGETLSISAVPGLVAGETLTAGQAVCVKASDGKVYKADADDADLRPCIGLAAHGASSGDAVDIATTGWVDGASSLTPGDYIYLSATAGGVTHTKTAGFAQVLGVALTETLWRLQVEFGYVAGHYA